MTVFEFVVINWTYSFTVYVNVDIEQVVDQENVQIMAGYCLASSSGSVPV